jgi:CheY-like chemotaxis protein
MTDTVQADAPSRADVPRSAWKVLVVDDDSFQLELLTGVLYGLGVWDVTTASNGATAMDQLGALPERFNLILLDLHMPGMDGFRFMEALAAAGYGGALIIVSGQSDAVLHAASLVAKLRRFSLLGSVSKPVGSAALSALI